MCIRDSVNISCVIGVVIVIVVVAAASLIITIIRTTTITLFVPLLLFCLIIYILSERNPCVKEKNSRKCSYSIYKILFI